MVSNSLPLRTQTNLQQLTVQDLAPAAATVLQLQSKATQALTAAFKDYRKGKRQVEWTWVS
jgi:hypothetical protein